MAAASSQSTPTTASQTDAAVAYARAELAIDAFESDQETANLASGYSVSAYFAAPRITTFTSQAATANNTFDDFLQHRSAQRRDSGGSGGRTERAGADRVRIRAGPFRQRPGGRSASQLRGQPESERRDDHPAIDAAGHSARRHHGQQSRPAAGLQPARRRNRQNHDERRKRPDGDRAHAGADGQRRRNDRLVQL